MKLKDLLELTQPVKTPINIEFVNCSFTFNRSETRKLSC